MSENNRVGYPVDETLLKYLKHQYEDWEKRIIQKKLKRLNITLETLKNSFNYLSDVIQTLKKKHNKELPQPMIFPGSKGGLEFEWSEKRFDLQISPPKDINKDPWGIYGINNENEENELLIDFNLSEGKKTKETLNFKFSEVKEANEILIEWLNKYL